MDGLGPVPDHFKFCLENGLNAHAVTEHGHMNSFSQALLFNEKQKKAGVDFKYIPGVEAYVHPDLEMWKRDKLIAEEAATSAKEQKKLKKKQNEGVKTEITRVTDEDDETIDLTSNSLTIENEEETKGGKSFNPVNRRHHLVILPKTSDALMKIFQLVSKGYLEGFYRFPRIDLKMIKEAAKDGDIILSSACLGGPLSFATLSQMRHIDFDKLDSRLLDDPSILEKCVAEVANTFDQYADAVGRKNMMLELQFNKLPAQDVVNRAIMEFARRNSLEDQLIVTADSHYPRPEQWKHREMYKKLGYLGYQNIGPDSLPKSKEELKCELYPKNAQQVWDEYLLAKERSPFYGASAESDRLVHDAIERTHDIAHEVIGDITFDKSYKYPTKIIPKETTAFKVLCELTKKGIIEKGLHTNPEYVERLKHELTIIKKMDNSAYFVTLAKALDLGRNVCLMGVARGSSGGSLVAYLLKITDLDPIKYECRFDRFLNVHRQGAPDIDVDVANRDLVLDVLRKEFGYNNIVPISNVNSFKIKSLVKDLSKFYGIPFDEANAALRTVDQEVRKATQKHGDDKNLFLLTYEDSLKYSPTFKAFIDKHPEISESISILFKEQRSLGRHAGGVVIMDDAPNQMPLIINKGEPQTPWVEGVGGKFLEPVGVIKYDLLGLETMRLIEKTITRIINKEGIFDIKVSGKVYHLMGDDKVKLSDGSEKLARALTIEDDVDDEALAQTYSHRIVSLGNNMARIESIVKVKSEFADVKEWYENNLHPDANNYDDPEVYKYVYEEGHYNAIFQCVDECTKVRLANGNEKYIKEIVEGDVVSSFDEAIGTFVDKEVTKVFDQGVRECIELTFDNGQTLQCTPDHPILTKRGWVKAGELTDDDSVMHFSLLVIVRFVKKKPRSCIDCNVPSTGQRCRPCMFRFKSKLDMSSYSIDKANLVGIDAVGKSIPTRTKFSIECDVCNEQFITNLGIEARKHHKWMCQSCAISACWKDSHYKESHVVSLKAVNASSAAKERYSVQSKKNWCDPEIRARMMDRDHVAVAKKSKETRRQNLLSGKTTYNVPHGKRGEVDGIWMRSTYETRFANALNASSIAWNYEPKWFELSNGKLYLPDFYIPSLDAYFEIKGWWRDDAKEKFDAFVNEYPGMRYAVVGLPQLKALEKKEITYESCVIEKRR